LAPSPTGLTTWSCGVLTMISRLSACVSCGGAAGVEADRDQRTFHGGLQAGVAPLSRSSTDIGMVPTAASCASSGVPL